jgi:hypothetical protein
VTWKNVSFLIIALDNAARSNITDVTLANARTACRVAFNGPKLHSDDDRKAAFERVRESLPNQSNVTDENNPPLWSFTFWPRDIVYLEVVDSEITLKNNRTTLKSVIVIGNTTYNLSDNTLDLSENRLPSEGGTGADLVFAYNNTSITPREILLDGKCLPGNDYIWGFSSILLFTFCMVTIAIALLLITLHFDAYLNSAADRYKLSISPYRDVLDLAEELRAHYGATETAAMPAKELDRAMREDPVATGLETQTLHRSRRARWKQAKASTKSFTRSDARKRSKVAESHAATDAEESLMSMGFDAQLHSEMEMAKLPARVASRSTGGM